MSKKYPLFRGLLRSEFCGITDFTFLEVIEYESVKSVMKISLLVVGNLFYQLRCYILAFCRKVMLM
ncbi:hypothetical protein RJ45_09485 [Photobacterium gaetbulicola]|uniref:Uncharacterized protein n=1 Tax=Photobacterium gaetbulicola TaxID=1295392 RepID=A0A0B9GGL3_9GAMM|nr:hypothetical protein RJ45_09485 [Photobacterium gaetbulicola]